MPRKTSSSRPRVTYEWVAGSISNIGVVTPHPYTVLFDYMRERDLPTIIELFFRNTTQVVDYRDLCVLKQFWWIKPEIKRARYIRVAHPSHYSGEYVFDLANGMRTVLEVRQPDLDGMHWKANHLHIKRGKVESTYSSKIKHVNFKKHIELKKEKLKGVYYMKVPEKGFLTQ